MASWLEILGLLRALVDGERGLDVLGWTVSPSSSDSGTNRSPMGSAAIVGFVAARFPLAAAAPIERRVVRLARSAASWSVALYECWRLFPV